MFILLFLFILLLCCFCSTDNDKENIRILDYKTKYFYISKGKSKGIFEKMKDDNISHESIKNFVILEDELMELEKKAVCSGISRKFDAFAISNKIKNRFRKYDFSYHAEHLKQIAEPSKIINRNITC
mgnify:FL=1|jgi:hypothetical protein